MPGPISAAITNALLLLASPPTKEQTPTILGHVHRRLQAAMPSMPASPQAALAMGQLMFCGDDNAAARTQMINSFAPQAVAIGVVPNLSEATTLLTSAFTCGCSARLPDNGPITTLYTTVMGVISQTGTPPDMRTFVNQVADVLPAVLGSGLLCSTDCQNTWKTLARFALDTAINVQALASARAVLADSTAMVPSDMITRTADSMVDCMCGGIDYRDFITPAIPFIMQQVGNMTVPQLLGGLSGGGGGGGGGGGTPVPVPSIPGSPSTTCESSSWQACTTAPRCSPMCAVASSCHSLDRQLECNACTGPTGCFSCSGPTRVCGGASAPPPPPFALPPFSLPPFALPPGAFRNVPPFPPMSGRRLQSRSGPGQMVRPPPPMGSAPAPSASTALALHLATTYVPLIFSSAFLCDSRCKASMENVIEVGTMAATIIARAQLRSSGAPALALSRVSHVNTLAPAAARATSSCLCGTGATFDWAGLISLGFHLASADQFDMSLVRRALKRVFGGSALCGGQCPTMMSSWGQIGATLLEGFSMQQIGGMVPDPSSLGRRLEGFSTQVGMPMVGRRLTAAVSDSLFGVNLTTAGVTAVHNLVMGVPLCICSRSFNWDGLIDMVEPMLSSSGSPTDALSFTSLLTDTGGCASTACTALATDALTIMNSAYGALGMPADAIPTCSASQAATCTSRCARCFRDDAPPPSNVPLDEYLRESGFSPDVIRRATVGSGPNRPSRAEIMARLSPQGGNPAAKLDAFGGNCSSTCQSTCADPLNIFVPICSMSQSCPPAGVAGYRVKFRANLAMSVADFDEARQLAYKQNVAEMFNSRGAGVNASQITLEITEAAAAPAGRALSETSQISVTSSVSVGSPIAQEIVTSTVGNLTTDSMNTFLGSSFAVTAVAPATTETVSGATGTINAPAGGTAAPASPPASSGSSTNIGLIIGAVAGGLVGVGLLVFLIIVCLASQRRTTTPMMGGGLTVVSEKPTSGLVHNDLAGGKQVASGI